MVFFRYLNLNIKLNKCCFNPCTFVTNNYNCYNVCLSFRRLDYSLWLQLTEYLFQNKIQTKHHNEQYSRENTGFKDCKTNNSYSNNEMAEFIGLKCADKKLHINNPYNFATI